MDYFDEAIRSKLTSSKTFSILTGIDEFCFKFSVDITSNLPCIRVHTTLKLEHAQFLDPAQLR